MKTNRGFERQDFYDDLGLECSIQESSSAIPHIWLGVNHAPVMVMRKDLSGISISMPSPECNERGWCTINLPIDALVESRMHLNREQALDLSKKLAYFSEHGFLQEDSE